MADLLPGVRSSWPLPVAVVAPPVAVVGCGAGLAVLSQMGVPPFGATPDDPFVPLWRPLENECVGVA